MHDIFIIVGQITAIYAGAIALLSFIFAMIDIIMDKRGKKNG